MPTWKRWVKYGRAYLDSALRKGNAELDKREADLESKSAERPWLRSSGDVPTVDDVRARIEHDAAASAARAETGAGAGSPKPATDVEGVDADVAFDRAEEQRRADERLRRIRTELGLAEDAEAAKDVEDPKPPEGPPKP